MRERKFLESCMQSIEGVSQEFNQPLKVTNITATDTLYEIKCITGMGVKYASVKRLHDNFALRLGLEAVRISRSGHFISFEIPKERVTDVKLSNLMQSITHSNFNFLPGMAVLGVGQGGDIVLIDLCDPNVSHILVGGTTGAGKSNALRTLMVSSTAYQSPEQVEIYLADSKGFEFQDFKLPHIKTYAQDSDSIDRMLGKALLDMEARHGSKHVTEYIIVIDELMALSEFSKECIDKIARLGRSAHIHIIGGTQQATRKNLSDSMVECFPARLALRVLDSSASRAITGMAGLDCHRLRGRGDGLLIIGGTQTRVQVAYEDCSKGVNRSRNNGKVKQRTFA